VTLAPLPFQEIQPGVLVDEAPVEPVWGRGRRARRGMLVRSRPDEGNGGAVAWD
jgi:hypothetical protein